MSTLGIIGGALGGVVGWMLGGPMGAMYGFAVGFGIGMMFGMDKPEEPATGKPQVSEFNISKAAEGVLINDFLGTTKMTGNIFQYGNNRNEEIITTAEAPSGGKGMMGGAGGGQSYVSGYKYFLTFAMGLCDGPVDKVYTIYSGETVIWEGELDRPESGGQEALTLQEMGSATFYFGTSDQVANSVLGALLSDATLNPGYRNQCYIVLEDSYIGDYNRAPVVRVVMSKTPLYDWTTREIIDTYFYNPACAIYYILEEKVGLSTDYIDEVSFAQVAETLYLEGNGITLLMDRQQDALNYLESILNHVDIVIFWSIDGKLHLKAIRDDVSIDDMVVVDQDMMLDDFTMERKSWLDTQNEIKVQYPLLVSDETYTLTTHVQGSGSVSPETSEFKFNTGLAVVASPSSGWSFERWSGDVSCFNDGGESASTKLKVPTYQDVDVTAWFTNLYGSTSLTTSFFDCSAALMGYAGVPDPAIKSGLWPGHHVVYGDDYPFTWTARFGFAKSGGIAAQGITITSMRAKIYNYGPTGTGTFSWRVGSITPNTPSFNYCGGRYTSEDVWFTEYRSEPYSNLEDGVEWVLTLSPSELEEVNDFLFNYDLDVVVLEVYGGPLKWYGVDSPTSYKARLQWSVE
jgi:hypothetical protein